jgi:hypothetical protein
MQPSRAWKILWHPGLKPTRNLKLHEPCVLVDGTDFRGHRDCRETETRLCQSRCPWPAACTVCESVSGQWPADGAMRQAACFPRRILVSGITEACIHVPEVGRRDRLSTVEKRRWGRDCAPGRGRAHGRAQSASLRVPASDSRWSDEVGCLLTPRVSGHTEACVRLTGS